MARLMLFRIVMFAAVVSSTVRTNADTFGSGANTFDIEFVTIGNPGNSADAIGAPFPAGKVDYTYRMGQFEISEQIIDKVNAQSAADGSPLGITTTNRGPDKPATQITWFEAAKIVNWLNTDSGSLPAYKFDGSGSFQLWQPGDAGYDANNLYRNKLATYFLPSVHEWYKAAYYDPTGVYYDYPTGSNTAPLPVSSGTAADTAAYDQSFATGPADIMLAGGLSPYGTMGQGGNVIEWVETDFDLVNDSILTSTGRGVYGGDWGSNSNALLSLNWSVNFASSAGSVSGFRVASIPEPNASLLASLGGLAALPWKRQR